MNSFHHVPMHWTFQAHYSYKKHSFIVEVYTSNYLSSNYRLHTSKQACRLKIVRQCLVVQFCYSPASQHGDMYRNVRNMVHMMYQIHTVYHMPCVNKHCSMAWVIKGDATSSWGKPQRAAHRWFHPSFTCELVALWKRTQTKVVCRHVLR